MKKILLFRELKSFFHEEKDIFDRAEFQIFTATSAEDIVKIHRTEQFDLIILQLDMDGLSAEKICSFLRNDGDLKHVSILIICNNTTTDIARVQKCKANSYVTRPILHEVLMQKVGQLLAIPDRQDYRVLVKVTVKGKLNNVSFFCSSYNISITGMLIETEKALETGDNIACSFFLPNSDQILTDAEIMRTISAHHTSFQYGIRYINLNPRYRAEIEKFIKRRSGKS
jgi:DNA-binding response OmpR family regulator